MSENETTPLPMSDVPPEMELKQVSDEVKKVLSDQYEEIKEEVEILYIPENISGRIHFMKNQPLLAPLILGEALMACDTQGTDDLEARRALEKEAGARQEKFSETLEHLEARSVEKGILQTEYVESLVKELGRDIALMLFSVTMVDRFLPLPSELPSDDLPEGQESDEPLVQPEEQEANEAVETPAELPSDSADEALKEPKEENPTPPEQDGDPQKV